MTSPAHKYRLLTDLPDIIPLFPLKNVILLPRSNLPLNIFEPRYLQMTDDVLGTNRLIGMIQPESGFETELSADILTPLRTTGCVGRLTEFSEMEDGRLLITLTGICRFDVLNEEKAELPYRLFKVDYSKYENDLKEGHGEDEVDREQLLSILKTYLQLHELDADWDSIDQSSNEFLVNTLSIISPYGTEEKQALLETPDLKKRSEVLMALAEMDIASRNDDTGNTIQ